MRTSSANLIHANFGEVRQCEVQLPRIPLPRTPVNKGKKKGRNLVRLDPPHTLAPFGSGRLAASSRVGCQPVEEGAEELRHWRWDGLVEHLFLLQNLCLRTVDDSHLLTLGCDYVFPVGYNPIKATTARHRVLCRGHVVNGQDVAAVSAREDFCRSIAQFTSDQPVAIFSAHYAVGAKPAEEQVSSFFARYAVGSIIAKDIVVNRSG